MAALLPVDEAQTRLLALAAPLPVERVAVEQAHGRTLAEPLIALRTQPATDLAAMDGYAVPPGSLAGPWQVMGESAAGHPFAGTLQPGQAVRIATGAVLPAGAGAVVMQEDLARAGDTITVTGTPPNPPARHIRRAGLDYSVGTELLPAGTRIGAAQLALAISAGHGDLPVHRLPRLAILDSGDELVRPGEPCAPHQLPASNGAMLAAMAAPYAGTIDRLGPVGDSMAALAEALARADSADVVVTSGGASVGDHDLIRPALAAWGAKLDFWKVAIRPGKPLMVARRGAQLVVGLPGNPVSSFVTAYLFLLPVLRALAGAAAPLPRPEPLRLTRPLAATAGRREYVRAWAEDGSVTPAEQHDSGALASLALANALIERPADAPAAAAGDTVLAYRLENGGVA